jgi:microsomal dipeptidase-like Zn-dependent dipeptidase
VLRALFAIIAAVLGLCVVVLVFAPPALRMVDTNLNRVTSDSNSAVSPRAAELHQRLFVADLHCDVLLWNRDLRQRWDRGHVDLPRLREGRVELQVFSMPTAYPLFANYRRSPSFPDIVGLAAIANRWPRATWFSPTERAFQQTLVLSKLPVFDGMLLVTHSGTLDYLNREFTGICAILSVEGLHLREGDINSVDMMFRAGVRVFGLAHMSDNAVAGSAHGWKKYGLTDFGRRVVARIDSLGGIIDLAHASEKTIDDVLAMPSVSVMVSHTGVDGTCPGERNLSDEHLRGISAHGGIIGIGFWKGAVCGDDAPAIARAIRYAVNVAGINAIALGSDFDGAVRTPFDAAGLVHLTDALLSEGFSEDEVARVMGLNASDFFARSMPVGPVPPRGYQPPDPDKSDP